MSQLSTINITTAAGARSIAVGQNGTLTIESPPASAIQQSGAFAGFRERIVGNDAQLVTPFERVKALALAPGGRAIRVTVGGGDGGPGAWSKTVDVPVLTTDADVWIHGKRPEKIEPDAELYRREVVSRLIVTGCPGNAEYVIPLDGLTAISLTEAS